MNTRHTNKYTVFNASYDYIHAHTQLKHLINYLDALESHVGIYESNNPVWLDKNNELKRIQDTMMSLLELLISDDIDIREVLKLNSKLEEMYRKYIDYEAIESSLYSAVICVNDQNILKYRKFYLDHYLEKIVDMIGETELLKIIQDSILELRDQLLSDYQKNLVSFDELNVIDFQLRDLIESTINHDIEKTSEHFRDISISLSYDHERTKAYQIVLSVLFMGVAILGAWPCVAAGLTAGVAICMIAGMLAASGILFFPSRINSIREEKKVQSSINTIGLGLKGFFNTEPVTLSMNDNKENHISSSSKCMA